MGFIKRLGWYLLGLSVGLIFLVFFLKKKSDETGVSFCYLPNCRVLKDIRSKPLFSSLNPKDTLYFNGLDDNMKNMLLNGSIDFGKSDTKSKPCKTYYIIHQNNHVAVEVKNCPESAILQESYLLK